jgi:hypothetical protein
MNHYADKDSSGEWFTYPPPPDAWMVYLTAAQRDLLWEFAIMCRRADVLRVDGRELPERDANEDAPDLWALVDAGYLVEVAGSPGFYAVSDAVEAFDYQPAGPPDGYVLRGELPSKQNAFVDIVFDGPPGPEAGRFVEVENEMGDSIALAEIGEWVQRADGYWALRIPRAASASIALNQDEAPTNA